MSQNREGTDAGNELCSLHESRMRTNLLPHNGRTICLLHKKRTIIDYILPPCSTLRWIHQHPRRTLPNHKEEHLINMLIKMLPPTPWCSERTDIKCIYQRKLQMQKFNPSSKPQSRPQARLISIIKSMIDSKDTVLARGEHQNDWTTRPLNHRNSNLPCNSNNSQISAKRNSWISWTPNFSAKIYLKLIAKLHWKAWNQKRRSYGSKRYF